jgi:hypothetical protein
MAHGELVEMKDYGKEYSITMKLSREFISKLFYSKNYSVIKLDCSINLDN